MHVFKLSMTAGPSCNAAPEGTTLNGVCLVDDDDASEARDGALLALDRLGFQSCTILDIAKLPPSPDVSRYSDGMRQAFDEARRDGVSVLLYAPDGAH